LASSKAFGTLDDVNYFVCFKCAIIYKAPANSLLFSPAFFCICVGRAAVWGQQGRQPWLGRVAESQAQGRGPILQSWGWPPGSAKSPHHSDKAVLRLGWEAGLLVKVHNLGPRVQDIDCCLAAQLRCSCTTAQAGTKGEYCVLVHLQMAPRKVGGVILCLGCL